MVYSKAFQDMLSMTNTMNSPREVVSEIYFLSEGYVIFDKLLLYLIYRFYYHGSSIRNFFIIFRDMVPCNT